MKKILYVITKSNWGGAQRYVFDLATNLPKESFETAVALGGEGLLKINLEKSGVRTITIPNLIRDVSIFKEFKVFFSLLKIYKNERPYIIHLNSSKIGAMGALAGRIYNLLYYPKAKIIFTSHGWAFNEDRNFLSKFVIKIIAYFTVLLSHKTIAVSKITKKQMTWPGAQKKMFVVKNAIGHIDFLDKETARNFLDKTSPSPLGENKIWLGTIGELHKIKGQKYLIEAISLLREIYPNILLIIIGEGEERKNLEKQIKDGGLENHVLLYGYLEEASRYLKAFDIFVLPSLSESLGYVLLEAGLSEVPIVSTKIGGIPEIIEDKKDGLLVSTKNPSEIKDAVVEIIERKAEAEKRASLLYKKITSEFSLEKMLVETLNVYKR